MEKFTSDVYKYSLWRYNVTMPIVIAVSVILGVVMSIIKKEFFPFLLIISFVLAGIELIMYFCIRKYLKKKIAELEKEENRQNSEESEIID